MPLAVVDAVGATVYLDAAGAGTLADPLIPTRGGTVGISGQPTVQFAPNQVVGVSGQPTIQIAANQVIGVSGQPTVSLAPGQSVGISGQPTVALVAGQSVSLVAGTAVGISGQPTVSIGNQPTVALAPNQIVGVSGQPTVTLAPNQIVGVSGTPTVRISPASSFGYGSVTLSTTASGTQLPAATASFGVTVRAVPANSASVYLGSDMAVASGTGFELQAGEAVTLEVANSNLIYVRPAASGQRITYLAV
jgi:hypothetical protein